MNKNFVRVEEVDAKTAFICQEYIHIIIHKHAGKESAQVDYDGTCENCRKQK